MAGLLAIVAKHGTRTIADDETRALLDAYAHARGTGKSSVLRGGDWVWVAALAPVVAATATRWDSGWDVTVGVRDPTTLADGMYEGQFAAARFDGTTLMVHNDPFGMQALYIAETRDRWLLSTSATVLARAIGAGRDPVGISLFLRAGSQFGPVTHWAGVARLEPATELAFTAGELTRRVYWQPTVDATVQAAAFDDAVELCVAALDAAIRRLPTDGASADLTGGYDSRMVVAAMLRRGILPVAMTSGPPDSRDVRLAAAISRAAGLRWTAVELPDDWPERAPAVFDHARRWSDGMLDSFQLAEVFAGFGVRRRYGLDKVVTGGGGEHFNHFPWMSEGVLAGRRTAVNLDAALRMRLMPPVDESWLRSEVGRTAREYAIEKLTACAHRYRGLPNTTQLDRMYQYKSAGHFGAYRSAGEGALMSFIPCYHREVFETTFSVPARFRNHHRLQRAIIQALNPSIARVATDRGGPAERATARNAYRFVPYYAGMARQGLRKLGLVKTVAARPDEKVERGREAMLAYCREEGLLAPGELRVSDLVDTRVIADSIRPGGRRDWIALGRLASVESALALAGTSR